MNPVMPEGGAGAKAGVDVAAKSGPEIRGDADAPEELFDGFDGNRPPEGVSRGGTGCTVSIPAIAND